jgi:D-sedoheptulose 7-phosphate isomerase
MGSQSAATATFTRAFLDEVKTVVDGLDVDSIENLATTLAAVRERGGRLFFLGVGGSKATPLTR